MSKPYIEISTKGMTRERWLTLRHDKLGGSDAAAVIGRNPYKSADELLEEKLSPVVLDKPNLACRHGTHCEPLIAELFTEETGVKVQRINFMYQSVEYPFMIANIDRKIVGKNAGLECKTTSVFNHSKFGESCKVTSTDEEYPFPIEYFAQVTHYMAVTGWGKWYIAVLIGNKEFRWYEVDRDERNIEYIIEKETKFTELLNYEKTKRSIKHA